MELPIYAVPIMATPQHSGDEDDGGASPAPPPPPPPPPQDVGDAHDKPPLLPVSSTPPPDPLSNKRVDYRELFALFHAEVSDAPRSQAAWDALWQLALAEAREDFRLQQLEAKKPSTAKKRGSDSESVGSSTPSRVGLAARLAPGASGSAGAASSVSGNSQGGTVGGADKRPRPPLPSDSDPNKAMRLNRALPNRPKPASKLMQKLGSRGS